MNLPDIEIVSAQVHDAWMALKRDAGVTSRKLDTTGEELMVPYAQLSEQAKELDRGTVRTVYAAIELIAASEVPQRYRVEFDGFVGTVIGSYKRLDGEEGVVMQQDGCKVVHVYRRKWLMPVADVKEGGDAPR